MTGENKDPIERLPELEPGEILADRYTVLQRLGRGATSVVYKARDTLANEVVALKVIRQITAGSDRALEGFRRELAVSRKLTHPNVIRIHDIGMDGRIFYIVMEFIDGQTLAEQLAEKGRLDPPAFFRLFHQFAEALRWIHQRNIVHRDVKPSNVMYNSAGVLKVTDFGIAKELGGVASTTRIGTPGYASPEQILGQKLTPASDIYSAGAMFFELLTATRPLAKRSLAEQCTLPPPSLAEARPDVPPLLCQIIEKCLQPDPAYRFQTVDELIAGVAKAEDNASQPAAAHRLLSDLATDHPPDLALGVALFWRAVNRVREIHEAGLMHDQLSPRNIYVLPNGAVEIDAIPLQTSSGATPVSEPKYVSPEAFTEGAFAGQQSSIAGDIYILGFVFYEFLAGNREFGKQFAQFSRGQNDIEWLRWHADLDKKLPLLRQFRPDCPRQLESLLEAMMAKLPAKRTKSLDEAAGILRELSSSVQETRVERQPAAQPVKETRPGDLATGIPVVVPRATMKIVGIAVAVLLVVGGAAVGWRMLQTPETQPAQPPQKPKTSAPPAQPKEVAATPTDTPPPAQNNDPAKGLHTASGVMVMVPKDQYPLGDNAAPVALGPFYIDKFETTNALYRKFCVEPGRNCPPPPPWDPDYAGKAQRPVIGVTWNDADAYCKSAGKRLPTNAEWEAAARGTDQRKYPWGSWMVPGLANIGPVSPDVAHTADVGSFPVDVSPFGASDMAGNAREWVSDDAPNGRKTVRGGSFDLAADQFSLTWKGSRLPGLDPANAWPVGLRCAADADAVPKLEAPVPAH